METLKRIANKLTGSEYSRNEPASPKSPAASCRPLQVDTQTASGATAGVADRPLSPRAQEFRKLEADFLQSGPRLL